MTSVRGLEGEVAAGNHAVIHLGGSEIFEHRRVEEALSSVPPSCPYL